MGRLRMVIVAIIFTISLFSMAGVYNLIWIAHPDYFRVQAGVNFLPTELFRIASDYSAFSKSPKPLPEAFQQSATETAANNIVEIYHRIQQTSVTLAEQQADLQKREQQDAGEYRAFEASQWQQYDQFVFSKTAPFKPEADALIAAMNNILSEAAVKSADDLTPGPQSVAYYALAIKLGENRAKMAQAELDARQYGMGHLTDFQKLPDQQQYLAHYHALEAVS
jgi:hypothetical protein